MNASDVFGILLRDHQRPVLAFLRGVLDEADALDVFQQAALVAWTNLDRYDRSRPFGPWLRGIAGRLLLKHLSRARRSVPLDEASLATLEARMGELDRLPGDTWNEKIDSLRECLRMSSAEDRELVEVYYRDGLSCAEIAERAGEGVETVKKRLQRLRASLFDCLRSKMAEATSG